MDSAEQPEVPALSEFQARLSRDEASGHLRSLDAYLEEFRGNTEVMARMYLAAKRLGGFSPGGPGSANDEDFIGHYKLERELGRGGQGVVYLAEDTHLHRHVALKVLTNAAMVSESTLRRFQREGLVASRLDHPGICGVHDAGTAAGVSYIAMQYIEGQTLSQMVAQASVGGAVEPVKSTMINLLDDSEDTDAGASKIHDIPPDPVAHSKTTSENMPRREVMKVVRMFEKAAEALHAAHEADIVHRDIKPGNIMIASDGRPVILDFGLAHMEDDDGPSITMSGDLFGTPAYMSPEQLTGNRVLLDRRTDIWSLGVTLYKCLTLVDAFTAPTRQTLYQAIISKDPVDPRRINPVIPLDLKIVIDTALEKDRDRRYATAHDFAEDLRRAREHEPILARPAGPIVKLCRWAQRKPALATAVGLLFVFLITGMSVTTWYATSRDRAVTEYERLADGKLLDDLKGAADKDLWPAVPDLVDDMAAWLTKAEDLAATLSEHREALQAVRAEEGSIVETGNEENPVRHVFENDTLQWRHDKLAELVDDIDAFLKSGLMDEIRARQEFASTLRKHSIDDHRLAWDQVIRDVASDSRFGGYKLREQLGLIPLGADPITELQEFACLGTGTPSSRDDATGRLSIDDETAIIFVLIPGGRFTMGAQRQERAGQNFDALAAEQESPVHEVTLEPFMIARFEMTQGQWHRLAGANPSAFKAGEDYLLGQPRITPRNPVESVSLGECMKLLRRHQMDVPTEARWEYACRGGTNSPYYCGDRTEDLRGHANLADAPSSRHFAAEFPADPELDDGFALHAPTGSFSPNRFGLFDMHGNVMEWVQEQQGGYRQKTRPGDGFRLGRKNDIGICRGGGFNAATSSARCASRITVNQATTSHQLGVRPVWSLHE